MEFITNFVFESEDIDNEKDDIKVDIDIVQKDDDVNEEDVSDDEIQDDEFDADDKTDEKARPPRLKKKERAANTVKAKVTKEMLGPDSPLKTQIDLIFKKIKVKIRKEAAKEGVPIGNINLNKITIRSHE